METTSIDLLESNFQSKIDRDIKIEPKDWMPDDIDKP